MDRFFFRFVAIHAFDRQTDGQTDSRTDKKTPFSRLDRPAFNAARYKPKPRRFVPWDVLHVLLGRNFVSDLPTLKPKKLKKPFKT